ncbi:MAG: MerR family transcriptional regulator [Desulfarculales bacterium]|jgi:DNA-binding transcriptional MerR regulator|nr:MerR family transcriptional regulator [Desulfarculales bacterium]
MNALTSIVYKPYYRIGEIAKMLGVETHVLRYWESEFPLLKPVRAPSGQRLYHVSHLDLLKLIKELLYDKGYTIAGAKKALDEQQPYPCNPSFLQSTQISSHSLHKELKELLNILK